MDKSRKCFRLISEVLVERTTGETLPAVKKNKEALEEVVKKLHRDMQQQEKELTEYQVSASHFQGGKRDQIAWFCSCVNMLFAFIACAQA
eukprot:1140465-Pelagomonas_calceolata.AAC.4